MDKNLSKKELIAHFVEQLTTEIALLKEATRATLDAATNEESQPENQYDTFALEASYLAGAQSKRVAEMLEVLSLFKSMSFKEFNSKDAIDMTALIDIKINGKESHLLMMPKGGGVNLKHGNSVVQIVTPSSALGETILGLSVGDDAEFEVGPQVKECEILAIR